MGDALAECFRDVRNLFGPVRNGIATPPKTAAAEQRIDLDLLWLQAENPRDGGLIDGLELTARPQFGAIAPDLDHAIQWLHRGMRQEGECELRIIDRGRARKSRVRIAAVNGN